MSAPCSCITVEALAARKRLPAEFLRDTIGLYDLPRVGVAILYHDPSGQEFATKQRTALAARDGSYWPKGRPIIAYGLHRLDRQFSE